MITFQDHRVIESTNNFKDITSVYVRDIAGNITRVYCRFSDGKIYVEYEEKVYRTVF